MSDRLNNAFEGAVDRIRERKRKYGLLGRHNADGSVTFVVPGRANYLFVRIRNANGAQTVVPARNDGAVPHSDGLPVEMRVENKTTWVIVGRTARDDLATVDPPPASGVPIHIHDLYYLKTEHIDVGAGAADAGKPVVLAADGYVDVSLLDPDDINGAVDSVNGQTGVVVLDADDIAETATRIYFSSAEETKLAGIAAGAEVNVNADWSSVAGDSQILNKPTITAYALTLLDDANIAAAQATLALTPGTNVQAQDAELQAIAGLTSAADRLPYFTGSGTAALATFSAFARTFMDDADAATVRTTLGLAIGTNVQAYDATLLSIAALGTAADKMLYTTGVDTWAETSLTAFGRSLIDDAAAVNARTTLGLVIGTDVQAQDAELAAIAGLTSAADRVPYFTGLGAAALATFTAFGRTLAALADAAAGRTALGLGTIATLADTLFARLASANIFTESQTIQKNQNATTRIVINNDNTGASAQAGFEVQNDSAAASFAKASAAYAGYKITATGDFYVYNSVRGDIAILNDYASGRIKLAAGGRSTPDVIVETNGNIAFGPAVAQGKLHVHDGTGGEMFVSTTGIIGAAQTLLADGTGDVTKAAFITGICTNGVPQTIAINNQVSNGGSYDVTMDGGTNMLRFAVSAGGALTVIRQAGAATWSISVSMVWQ